MKIQLERSEIESIFRPFVKERISPADRKWKDLCAEMEATIRKAYYKRLLLGWLGGKYKRTQRTIEMNYSSQWEKYPLQSQLSAGNRAIPVVWGEEPMYAQSHGLNRVFLLALAKVIRATGAKKVLEVGFGNGLNLLVLAGIFPDVEFHGAELTEGGVNSARRMQSEATLPAYLREFSPEPHRDPGAHKRISFRQGSAAALPFESGSFDLAFTVLALEQMEEIRSQALRELARVSRRHVAMIEPFFDWNSKGMRRDYIKGQDYFSARIDELPTHGLKPVFVSNDIPNKLRLGVGIVVAEAAR